MQARLRNLEAEGEAAKRHPQRGLHFMAQSEAHRVELVSSQETAQARTRIGERTLRRAAAWLILFFLLQGELGAVWDREWHAYVGRDQFWTPPHTLIYTCAAGAGLMALIVVLLETLRYRRGVAGVNDSTTFNVFRIFHAPLGFIVSGFGALIALTAAPLDNYWHELYGIDIALWAPFHMMGVTGATLGIIGIVYTFASEAAIDRQSGRKVWRFLGYSALELGALITLAGLMNFVLIGFLQFPTITIGTLHISTYPLPMVGFGSIFLIGSVRLTGRPGTATFATGLLFLHTFMAEIFTPWAVRTAVAVQGGMYRDPSKTPSFNVAAACIALIFLVSAIMIDLYAYRRQRQGKSLFGGSRGLIALGAVSAFIALAVARFLLIPISPVAPAIFLEPGFTAAPETLAIALVLVLLVTAITGALGAIIGDDLGEIWHLSTR